MSVAPVATKMRVAAPIPSTALHRPRPAAAKLATVERRNLVERRDQAPQLRRIEARLDLDAQSMRKNDAKLSMPRRAGCRRRFHPRRAIRNNLDRHNFPVRSKRSVGPILFAGFSLLVESSSLVKSSLMVGPIRCVRSNLVVESNRLVGPNCLARSNRLVGLILFAGFSR